MHKMHTMIVHRSSQTKSALGHQLLEQTTCFIVLHPLSVMIDVRDKVSLKRSARAAFRTDYEWWDGQMQRRAPVLAACSRRARGWHRQARMRIKMWPEHTRRPRM